MDGVTRTASSGLPSKRALLEGVAFVLTINVVGALPVFIAGPDTPWFRSLEKPAFYPPEIAFPVVWTLLFTLMGVALWLVWRSSSPGRRLALGLFGLQMVLNIAWTPAFFGLENLAAGLAVIVPLWVVILATIVAFERVDRRAAGLLVPYLLWVTFATVLNYRLWQLNA